MFNVFQHWDPLKLCVVGRAYPPEYFSWVKNTKARKIFEQIAVETEEDFQQLIKKIEEFGTEILRPEIESTLFIDQIPRQKPPVTPRDHMVMIGKVLYSNISTYDFGHFYYNAKQADWPECASYEDIDNLPSAIQKKCRQLHSHYKNTIKLTGYENIFRTLADNNNIIKTFVDPHITGPMVSRIGKDLYFGTYDLNHEIDALQHIVDKEFPRHRNHVVNTGGHSDSTFCPICPGFIISLYDVPTYQKTFPDWEVLYLDRSALGANSKFFAAMPFTKGRWWIPNIEHTDLVTEIVETYMNDWIGNVQETVFDVNMLIVDAKNVIVNAYNKTVFQALARYGITPHVVSFRHRFFWDGGIHCLTNDLHRAGVMQDFFPINSTSS